MYEFNFMRDKEFVLKIRVIPNAKKNKIIDWRNDTLKIKLTAPPIKGKANKMLFKFLAKKLNIKSSEIEIIKGEKSRDKLVRIKGLDKFALDFLL